MSDLVNPNDKICSNEEIQSRKIYKARRLVSNTTTETNAERGRFRLIKPTADSSETAEPKLSNPSNPWVTKNPFLKSKNERTQAQSKSDFVNPFKKNEEKEKDNENKKNPFLANKESPFRNSVSPTKAQDGKDKKPSAWTSNPFSKVSDYKKDSSKEFRDSQKKTWFPRPLEIPNIKTEEQKLAQDCNDQSEEAETYEPSPTKNRFRHNNENANRLFTNEIEEF